MALHSSRRRSLIQGEAAALALPSLAAFAQTPACQLRIGHEKGVLSLLKGRGKLEKRLAPLKVSLKWTEFTAGPVQLEALNGGSIDFDDVGETPPIFTQAAGAPLAYLAATVQRPRTESVLVSQGSAIKSVGRTAYGTSPVSKAILAKQQQIADSFFALGLIPRKIRVLDAAAANICLSDG